MDTVRMFTEYGSLRLPHATNEEYLAMIRELYYV